MQEVLGGIVLKISHFPVKRAKVQHYAIALTLPEHLTGFQNLSGVGSMLVNNAVHAVPFSTQIGIRFHGASVPTEHLTGIHHHHMFFVRKTPFVKLIRSGLLPQIILPVEARQGVRPGGAVSFVQAVSCVRVVLSVQEVSSSRPARPDGTIWIVRMVSQIREGLAGGKCPE